MAPGSSLQDGERDSTAMWDLPNRALAAHTSPRRMRMEKAAQRIHLPARLVSPTASKTLPGSLEIFPACFFGSYYFSFFTIKAHLEATNALQVCKGWALNISQRVLPGVPPRELLALPPPWTQRHPGEQQPQPGLGGVVGFKYLQRKKEKKTRGKNSKQQTK